MACASTMPACRSNCRTPTCRRPWGRSSVRRSSTEAIALLIGALALLMTLLMAPLPAAHGADAPVLPLQDDEQRPLDLARPAQRIVSLAPGATAMLCAAGPGQRVVGTSDYSNEPEAAKAIERVGDSQSFDLERILGLHPDVVVVWSGGTSPTQVARLESVGLRIYRHRLTRLDDIAPSLVRLGRLTGTQAAAQAAAAQITQRIGALRNRYLQAAPASVLLQAWDRPIYTVGRAEIMTDVIHACGYRNLYKDFHD